MQYSYYTYLFHQFLLLYNVSYDSPLVFMERFEIFVGNMRFVEEFNLEGTSSVTLGVTVFADRTLDEFSEKNLGLLSSDGRGEEGNDTCMPLVLSGETATVEVEHFDWRDHGVLTPIKDQGDCGSCWAFSTVETAESVAVLGGGFTDPPLLSPGHLMDCAVENRGCSGGCLDVALEYLVAHGAVNESDYPYTPRHGDCVSKETAFTPSACFHTANQWEAVLSEKGPLVIAIDAKSPVFQFYTGGIIRSWDCGTQVNHAVQLVGFGVENGVAYWTVRNSWGSKWGEQGYFRLQRSSIPDENACGIMTRSAWGLVA